MKCEIIKIVSGGQTGADRAALDWAIEHGIPHEGWCPKGRWAEDGPIDGRYQLQETPTENYVQRTEWNARDSEAVSTTVEPKKIAAALALGHDETLQQMAVPDAEALAGSVSD